MDIVVSGLFKSFGDKKVLENFNATLPEGECTCIMGPSGCGKTTLLNILMGLLRADSGEVSGVPEKKSAVFQEDRLCEEFSAVTNVRLVLGREVSDHDIERHLYELGLRGSTRSKSRDLSGGMKRRVAIARAVLATEGVLFMDEPLKGLDPGTKSKVIGYIKRYTTGKTVVLVTHDINEAQALSDHIIRLGEAG